MNSQQPAGLGHWERFCDELKGLGQIVAGVEGLDGLDEAEGYRYLTRLLRLALEMNLEHGSARHPSFYSLSHETAKIGGDNPDNIYLNANVAGAHDYLITGDLGTAPYLSIGTKENRYAIDGRMISTGEIDLADLSTGKDGAVRVVLSKNPQPGNWLPMTADTNMVIVRQTFNDRTREIPARLAIQRLEPDGQFDLLSLEEMFGCLGRSLGFVKGTANTFLKWMRMFEHEHNNRFNLGDQQFFQAAGGDPNICYLYAYFEMEAHEVLRVATEVPTCDYWNFQLTNIWMESLDYRHHPVHLNGHLAQQEDPAEVRIHVSQAPVAGLANNLVTTGHRQGLMMLRWVGATEYPIPTIERFAIGDDGL